MNENLNLAAALTLGGLTVGAIAHGGATGFVKERMDAMSAISKAMKTIGQMMQGKEPYDAAAVRLHVATIKSHAGLALTRLFPPDSLQKPSEAKEEIWTNWQEFEVLANQLSVYAEGLEHSADNKRMHIGTYGTDHMRDGMMTSGKMPDVMQLSQMPAEGVFNMLAKTCSACHQQFRLKKQ